MSGAYQVWVFDGRQPELLGAVADKGAGRKLWRNSRHAVIAGGGVVLETRSGTSAGKLPALTLAVAAAWREAGGAPPAPLPVPGTKVPREAPARRSKPEAANDGDDEIDDPADRDEGDEDGAEDLDDRPDVDLEADDPSPQPDAQRITPAPQETGAIATIPPPQRITPPDAPATPPPVESRAAAATEPAPVVPEVRRRDRQVLVQPSTRCPACGEPSYTYRPELPEAFRDLCRRDRVRARAWQVDGRDRTPELARAHLLEVTVPSRAAAAPPTPASVAALIHRPAPKPPARRAPTPKKHARSPAWSKFRGQVEQLLTTAGRLGGLEGLRALEKARAVDPVAAVAAAGARDMARLKASHCAEYPTQADGRPMLVTAQWLDGKSPLTLRTEAMAERDAATAAMVATQKATARLQALADRVGGIERLESIVERFDALVALGAGTAR